MRVVITDEARSDLSSIADYYVALESPVQAVVMVERLERACRDLADSAMHHSLIANWEAVGIRRKVMRPYSIIDRIRGGAIEVIHVLHGARDLDRILTGD